MSKQDVESLSITTARSSPAEPFTVLVSLYKFPEGHVLAARSAQVDGVEQLMIEVNDLMAQWLAYGTLGLEAYFDTSYCTWGYKATL